MIDLMEQVAPARLEPETDLAEGIREVVHNSDEPLSLTKIRAALPNAYRNLGLENVADALQRLVAAQVLVLFPRYRSQQDRYWDRPMAVHLEFLLRGTLAQGPLTWSEIRKRLPEYAKVQTESVLEELVARGQLHRHPPARRRLGPRFGLQPADPRPYLEPELNALFARWEQVGFVRAALRGALLELLHRDEWDTHFVHPETGGHSVPHERWPLPARRYTPIHS